MASSSSSSVQIRYQVFLSFRGEDTRHSFTSHLLKALKDRGISVFFDENELKKGEELTPALLQAIEASKMSIIILSKDYASSKSCLAELSKIMECKDSPAGQIVLPIFYQVNPSDVRHHSGPFEESFHQHLINKPEEAKRWKAVFTQAGNLKGWHIDGGNFDRSETGYIEDIVKVVLEKLTSLSASVSKHSLVGLNDHVVKIVRFIDQEDIRVIGIWGMGGIGKTTLAESIYNEVVSDYKFGAHHFLWNVRESSKKKGMQSLQNELLSKLLKEDIKIDTPTVGSELILDRLHNIRALVVLDDVSNFDQIDGLGVEHFGPGSKIIVTSRDQQVLKNIGANEVYKLEGLNDDDSLKLFCNFAFKQYNPIVDFRNLSMKFLSYARGQPLALKVLGAALYQRSMDVWESALEKLKEFPYKLKEYPEKLIFGPLKISLDGLGCLEQNIFLDVACFFVGEHKDSVTKLLEGFYKGARFGITNLVDKCLLDDGPNYFRMHDLLQEMGRDIVRQESKDPGRRSRLWRAEDVYDVFKYNKGTNLIKGISVDMSRLKALQIGPAIFRKMVNLVFIRFYCKDDSGNKLILANEDLNYLPDCLRYFHWDYSPLKSLPSNFNPHKLVELCFRNSNIKLLWDGDQEFVNLRRMDLSMCKNLQKIPTLLGATKLEELNFEECESLVELWDGDQEFINLRMLELNGCKKIRKIPNLLGARELRSLDCTGCVSLVDFPCMTHLIALTNLSLGDCPISKLPEIPTNIEELDLGGTQIEEVPSLIGSLKKLWRLNISRTKVQNIPSSIWELDAFQCLALSDCPNITELNLNMWAPPTKEQFSPFPRFKTLDVNHCESLKSLSGLPPWLQHISATSCASLERVSYSDNIIEGYKHYHNRIYVQDCKRLKTLSGLPPCIDQINARNCKSLESVSFTNYDDCQSELGGYAVDFDFQFDNCFTLNQDARDNIFAAFIKGKIQVLAEQWAKESKDEFHRLEQKYPISCSVLYYLPASEILDKFENKSRNSLITVKLVDSATNRRFLCFALCLVFDLFGELNYPCRYYIDCKYQLKDTNGVDQDFERIWSVESSKPIRMGPNHHVFVMSQDRMVHLDMNYTEASFDFKVHRYYYDDDGHVSHKVEIKVERCGVHVVYVEEEEEEETNISCSHAIIQSSEEDANVANGHGEPATTISRLNCKRSSVTSSFVFFTGIVAPRMNFSP